ncbi:hypothetical protein NSQ95_04280 [Psychrobacillus sp. FSL W7-1457]|uniref:hypothetical protein n=1 Tax=Psychrobacillus sp. FSL W7-1457 TaxID=2954547 RepID=UPI00315AD7F2
MKKLVVAIVLVISLLSNSFVGAAYASPLETVEKAQIQIENAKKTSIKSPFLSSIIDQTVAKLFMAMLYVVPPASKVKESDEKVIKVVRATYEKLTAKQKKLVDITRLVDAENALIALKAAKEDKKIAAKVVELIDQINKESSAKQYKQAVTVALTEYNKLTDKQKALVTNSAKLTKEAADLKAAEQEAAKITPSAIGELVEGDILVNKISALIGEDYTVTLLSTPEGMVVDGKIVQPEIGQADKSGTVVLLLTRTDGTKVEHSIELTVKAKVNLDKGLSQISLFKDSTSSTNKIDFTTISNFALKNKETNKVYNVGTTPNNQKNVYQMKDLPTGSYTIELTTPDVFQVDSIQLGESYKETIYDPANNPLVITKNKTTYVKIVLKSDITLQEIKPLESLTVPFDISYDDFVVALPKQGKIVDSRGQEHTVPLKWDVRPFQFENYTKPGTRTLSSEFFDLPLEVSNSTPAQRLEMTIQVIFPEPEKSNSHISLFKDSTSSMNKMDFTNISNFSLKNKKTNKVYQVGTTPSNQKHVYQMKDIPEGSYTIHFDTLDSMSVSQIELGESYKETIYNADTNPLVITKGKTAYVKIVVSSEVTLETISRLETLTVPADITYDDFLAQLPKQTTIIDSDGEVHTVAITWDVRPFQFTSYKKPGTVSLTSQFFKLPIEVSNSTPAQRLEVGLQVIFAAPNAPDAVEEEEQ